MSESWPDSAVAMTLSAIAYSSDIPGQLSNPNYATTADWFLVWGPVVDDYGNLAYVAKSNATARYALVIRGSETTFSFAALENWFYDLDVVIQDSWPLFPGVEGCRVAHGAYVQASGLTKATWSGQALAAFLTQDVPAGATLIVTGHSLGGNLATVLASWISPVRGSASEPDRNTVVYTFAAPSAGNQQFSEAFNQRFPQSWRYWNSLDIVPRAWDDLSQINTIYAPFGLPTPDLVQDAVDAMQWALSASEDWYESVYEQTNGQGTELEGSFTPTIDLVNEWFDEVQAQHASNTYLSLLKAPPVQSIFLANPAAFTGIPILKRPVPEKMAAISLFVGQRRRVRFQVRDEQASGNR